MSRSTIASLLVAILLIFAPVAKAGGAYFAVTEDDSLSTSASCEAALRIKAQDSRSTDIDSGDHLWRVDVELTSIVTAATITIWLARSSDGENAITDQVDQTIVDEDSDGNGSISTQVNSPWVDDNSDAATTPYICMKTNAGTATAKSRLLASKNR